MRKLAISLVVVLALLAIGHHYRLALLLAAAPRIAALKDPIDPHREVSWSQGPATAEATPVARPPNIVLIVADDMGFNDVSFYGGGAADGAVQTPHIDSIARDGVAFMNGYAGNAVCAPSRASIMTGRYATRFGFEFTPFFKIGVSIAELMSESDPSPLKPVVHRKEADAMRPMAELGMPPSEITLAEVLKSAGYQTDYYTDEAIRVIEANRNRPFFLYLAHWGIHNPLQAKKEDYDALSHIGDHRLRVYAAMITALDRGVGRVLDALAANGLADDTLVIFTSDNGGAGYLGLPDINKPYRGWKLTLFEGGTHVPFSARWPGHITPGTRYDAPIGHIDILPTAVAAAGARLPDDRTIDGVDVLPFVRGEREGPPHETLFWREGYHQAVLHDGWKLIVSARPDKKWLFDLRENPAERPDLAPTRPEMVAKLQALLDAHNAEQAEPLWPSVIESPQLIDKTSAEPYVEGDEYTYWPN